MSMSDHHLNRAELYLRFALDDFLDEQYPRAANALHRSATHAASAILSREGRPTRTRRRLLNALAELVQEGHLKPGHLLTFRLAHDLPDHIATASPAESLHLVRTTRRRVKLFVRDVSIAVQQRQPWERYEQPDIPRLLSNRPTLQEMHTTVPARCNNLALPPVRPPNLRLAYNPDVCPKCANLPLRSG